MPDRLRLPIFFDAAGLRADAERLATDLWLPHFNSRIFEGDWSGVALRSNGGGTSLYPDPHAQGFRDTPALDRCPHVRAALTLLRCDITSVRFLRLGPSSRILEHRDYDLAFAAGEARIHACVQTNDRVTFLLDSLPIVMAEGECWYVDVNRPHSVENLGDEPRIHLVIDCVVNDWLRKALQ
ncbi:MAG TPA: aspartyl/asparaginyl beta-hydroxylase domain-containing protein [Candidatus Baltobacteraceae bacterium]|nr:aspartyl/asparaginyl beta-hydroxylase domain-containing protein [Candidatus Baltobacteraceae bacterium]